MTEIKPAAFLRVYDDDRDAFGHVFCPPVALSYDLPGLLGSFGASYSGFARDPTGTYLMQQMVPVFYDADPSQWTVTNGQPLQSTYSYGTDPAYGVKFLYHQAVTDPFDAVLALGRVLDEGFYANFYIGAAVAAAPVGTAKPVIPAVNFYVEFSRHRTAGEPGLRLALEPGKNIRLQVSLDDDVTWTDVSSADSLGECETYLAQNGRQLNISVLPMTDASWEVNLPVSLDASGPPPGLIVVSINGGDAVLTYADDGLAEGQMAVTGQFRQWSCRPCLLRFCTAGSVVLPPQVSPVQLQSDPDVFPNGYVPGDGSSLSGQVIVDSLNSAHVEMTLSAVADDTGFAARSCFLASVDAEFPAVQQQPGANPSYVDYPLVFSEVDHWWDQTISTLRHRAEVWLTNEEDEFAPGSGAALGVRAARLFHSVDGINFKPEMTGWTGMEESGQEWIQQGNLRFFKMTVSDKLVHTEPGTTITCGYQLPYDFQCQYYGFGQQAYRLSIPDNLWQFPLVRRNQATPYYYFDGGTTRNPVHQFRPDMGIGQSMEHIRKAGAAFDPVSGTPVPMTMGTDPLGNLLFYGLPIGVVSLLSDPSMTLSQVPEVQPVITFSSVPEFYPDGSAVLNEFVQTWSSKTSLRNVRTPVVFLGLDPQSGAAIYGVAYNEKLGGSRYADPNQSGYIAVDKPLYVISRAITSQAVADLAASNAAIQLAAPAIDSGGQVHLQPGLMPLTVVAVNDYTTQGTTLDVGYYLTRVKGTVDVRDSEHPKQSTLLSGRILGLSA